MTRTLTRPERLVPAPRVARRPSAVWHMIGIVCLVASVGMVSSGAVALLTDGRAVASLVGSGIIAGALGAAIWVFTRTPDRISPGQIHAAVLFAWLALSVVSTLPFLASGTLRSFDDALFESISGFTTTGATVLFPIEGAARGILFWRSMTQWIGGVGVIVFAIAVLPYLKVGGMDLLDAEAPGPTTERLVPRVRETAKRLVLLYVGFSAVVALLYWAFGMGVYDAVAHMFTTVATGGFSPYQASFAHFGSASLEWVAIGAMVFAGGSFALYWRAIKGRPLVLLRSSEFHAYLGIITFVTGCAVVWNIAREGASVDLVRRTVFTVVSLTSSTGFTDLDYDQWAGAVQLLLLLGMAMGGMAGSTTGGFKVFRLLTIVGYVRRQVFQQFHPRAIAVVRSGRDVIPEDVVSRVVGFFALFVAIVAAASFLVAALADTDPISALSAVATSIGNVGPGMNEFGPLEDFTGMHRGARAVLMVVMLCGRLEIFPVLLGTVTVVASIRRRLPTRNHID